MMAVQNAPAIAAALVEGGRPADTPVAVICDGTMPGERTVLSTLERLAVDMEEAAVRRRRSSSSAAWSRSRIRNTLRDMATLHEITDPTDPRLADYRDLRDVELRKHLEATHGLFIAEGDKVVRRAVEAGFTPRSFLMAARWLDGLDDVLSTTDAPCYVVSEALAEEVTGFHVHRGALASLERRPLPSAGVGARRGHDRCWCWKTSSTMPTSARSSARRRVRLRRRTPGAEVRGPALPPIDQGRHGRGVLMPWTRLPDWYDALPTLSAQGFTTVALTLADDASAVEDAVAGLDRVALVLGSEGHGLSSRWEQSADRRAIIPMREGIDSLNVAAATAVACYVTAKRGRVATDRGVG